MSQQSTVNIAITGAAGNLGSLLANHLADDTNLQLHLLYHKKEVAKELMAKTNVSTYPIDLASKQGLTNALNGADVVVHFAGVLFMHKPEKFLPITNTQYFSNLLDIAIEQHVKRIILISFPHVEGESTPDNPATGKLDGKPQSAHAATRLEEEKMLFSRCAEANIEAVSLRLGMVYGRGILMIDAARWFSKRALLGIWRKPTYIHLISTIDYLNATQAAIVKPHITGIYHVGDEGVQTLQQFLDDASRQWHSVKPWRMPVWMIMTAAQVFEWASWLFKVRSPLTKDFIRIGMTSYYGDTNRMRSELLPTLSYSTFKDGINTL